MRADGKACLNTGNENSRDREKLGRKRPESRGAWEGKVGRLRAFVKRLTSFVLLEEGQGGTGQWDGEPEASARSLVFFAGDVRTSA